MRGGVVGVVGVGLSTGLFDFVLNGVFVFLNFVLLFSSILFLDYFVLRLEPNQVLQFLAAGVSAAVPVFVQVLALGGLRRGGLEVGGVIYCDVLLGTLPSGQEASGVNQRLALLQLCSNCIGVHLESNVGPVPSGELSSLSRNQETELSSIQILKTLIALLRVILHSFLNVLQSSLICVRSYAVSNGADGRLDVSGVCGG